MLADLDRRYKGEAGVDQALLRGAAVALHPLASSQLGCNCWTRACLTGSPACNVAKAHPEQPRTVDTRWQRTEYREWRHCAGSRP